MKYVYFYSISYQRHYSSIKNMSGVLKLDFKIMDEKTFNSAYKIILEKLTEKYDDLGALDLLNLNFLHEDITHDN